MTDVAPATDPMVSKMEEDAVEPMLEPTQDADMDVAGSPAPASESPAAGAANSQRQPERKRPRLDLSAALGGRTGERRKGKSIFGMVVGTLNKAKIEDKERNASEAAKKRQMIDARLQAKLTKEQTIVRNQDESKKDKIAASRKEEDLFLKDSILKHRYTVLPNLSNFLITTDIIPADLENSTDTTPLGPLAHPPPTSRPHALYYLPKILTPSQEAFLIRRRNQAEVRVREERAEWTVERQKGLEAVKELKLKADQARQAFLDARAQDTKVEDEEMVGVEKEREPSAAPAPAADPAAPAEVALVDDVMEGPAPIEQDEGDDAVEY